MMQALLKNKAQLCNQSKKTIMKNLTYLFSAITLVIFISITSCSTKKRAQTSKTSSTRVTKNTPTTTKTEPNTSKSTSPVKAEEKKSDSTPVEKKTATNADNGTNVKFVALPPINVDKIFKTDYPKAANIFWAKENETTPNYKVTFSLAEKNNMLRYSQKGEIIETRTEILSEQLPPNVLKSIMTKYPDAKISYVYTYKSTSSEGAYIAWIQTEGKEKEILLLENGDFVK